MRQILLISTLLALALRVVGQDTAYRSADNVFFEIGGAGFISTNYEKLYRLDKHLSFSGRGGIGFFPTSVGFFSLEKWTPIVPLMANLVYGKALSLEAGMGLTLGFIDFNRDYRNLEGIVKWWNGTIGLRYQPAGKGILIRLGYTPQLLSARCKDPICKGPGSRNGYFPLMGLSMGTRIGRK